MPYAFENRIVLRDKTLESLETSRVIHESGTEIVTLTPEHSQTGFKNADWIILQGKGFPTPEAAFQSGRLWRQQLSVAFTKGDIAADFDAMPAQHLNESDPPIDPEARGLRVYLQPPDGAIIVIGGRVELHVARSLDVFLSEDLPVARQLIPRGLDPQLELAFATFHLALATTNPEVKYILFVTAIEALIADTKPEKADTLLVSALKELRGEVKESERWNAEIRNQISKVLEDAQKESITRLGKDLAGKLDPKRYDGKSARKFFDENYAARSTLVHGNTSENVRPEPSEIARRLPLLKEFVLDLLTLESANRAG